MGSSSFSSLCISLCQVKLSCSYLFHLVIHLTHNFCSTSHAPHTGEGYHSEQNRHWSCSHGAYSLLMSYKLWQTIRWKRPGSCNNILKGGLISPGIKRFLWGCSLVPYSLSHCLRSGPGVPSSVSLPFWQLIWIVYLGFGCFCSRCHVSVMPFCSVNYSQRRQGEHYQKLSFLQMLGNDCEKAGMIHNSL